VKKWQTVVRELSRAQKQARGVSLWSRYVNRPLGRVIAATAVVVGLSANGVTVISALTTVAGLAVLVTMPPGLASGLLVAVLLILGFALDSADGQVARYTGTGSPAGEWLDHVVDAGKMVAVHAAVLVAWYRFELAPADAWYAVPLLYQLVAVVVFAGGTLAPLLRRAPAGTAAPSTVRAIALLPADYGVLALSFATWGSPGLFRAVYSALGLATLAIGAGLCAKWFRMLRSRQAAPR